ncbi:DUF2920 family protein [Paenibacillus sp. YYML68]|uniref:DUF2920 family protein n=1 Tax=Paenibacillus sp. YYML68 TaxID=2909250 RepID=UPI0024903B13|nr:DUF2920 family protein [Paenibacillus sp. YYML68]
MATSYNIDVSAHPSIYGEIKERKMPIMFSTPESGVNDNTGLLLLLPPIGLSCSSEETKSLCEQMADEHNIVTVLCQRYFGQEFFSDTVSPRFEFDLNALKRLLTEEEFNYVFVDGRVDMNKFLDIASHHSVNLMGYEQLNETPENFNDMSLMQALDNITALLVTIELLKDNGLVFNTSKIIAYGEGHGAYLAYLCNALAPRLFGQIIDKGGWIIPPYVSENRFISYKKNSLTITVIFDYLIKRIDVDMEVINLIQLYRKVPNFAQIVSFNNNNIPAAQTQVKKNFCESLRTCLYNEINFDFNDEDFFRFFDYVMKNLSLAKGNQNAKILLPNQIIETKLFKYCIDYSNKLPVLIRTKNKA